MIYFTSDHHFSHRNILVYTGRNHNSVEAMDEALIVAWNRTVGPSDTVYHLGDFTLGGEKVAAEYFGQLNGAIKVVPGGHDRRWAQIRVEPKYLLDSANGIPTTLLPPLYTIKVEGHIIVLCHFALRVWDRSHYNSLHLYGHSHGRLPLWPRSMDVGVDAVGYEPISVEAVIKQLS